MAVISWVWVGKPGASRVGVRIVAGSTPAFEQASIRVAIAADSPIIAARRKKSLRLNGG